MVHPRKWHIPYALRANMTTVKTEIGLAVSQHVNGVCSLMQTYQTTSYQLQTDESLKSLRQADPESPPACTTLPVLNREWWWVLSVKQNAWQADAEPCTSHPLLGREEQRVRMEKELLSSRPALGRATGFASKQRNTKTSLKEKSVEWGTDIGGWRVT